MKQTYQPKKRQSRKGARLPRPDEDHRGTPRAGPRRAMAARSSRSDGGRDHNSPRLVMLSSPEDFATLQGQGSVRSNPLLVVRNPPDRPRGDALRVFSTGRKLGGAVGSEPSAQATP